MVTASLDTVLNRLRDSRPVRYGAMLAIGGSAGDFEVDTTSVKNALRGFSTGAQGARAVKEAAKAIFKSIDPRLEAMEPEDILSAGASFAGNSKSPFIANPKIITPKEWEKLGLMVESGLVTDKELISFYNVLGQLHHQQAEAALAYKETPSPEIRRHIASLNNDAGVVPSVLILHAFCKKDPVRQAAERGELTLDNIKAAYPKSSRVLKLIQTIDDQRDILLDIADEIRTGKPSPNNILAIVHEQGGLVHDSGRIMPSITVASAKALKTNAPIPASDLHPNLRKGLESADGQFREDAAKFNPFTRTLLLAAWEDGLKRGIKPADNDRYHQAIRR